MFHWLQVKFQRHFRWIFITVTAIVCLSFVLTVGNFSLQDVAGNPNNRPLDFYGYNLQSRPQMEELEKAPTSTASSRQDAHSINKTVNKLF